MLVELKLTDYLEMVRHARATAPIEDCGLLGGRIEGDVKKVEKVFYLTNTDQSEEHFLAGSEGAVCGGQGAA